jgi:transposase
MAAERLSMRRIKEVLRLKALGQSPKAIAQSLQIGQNTVRRYVRRAEAAELGWPLPPELGDAALEALLFPPPPAAGTARPAPDWAEVQRELRRKGVTLQLLWLEYKAVHPEAGYQYTQFCEHYRRWRDHLDPVLRQEHRAGEKVFVDYAGQTLPVVDPDTGEIREAQIFIGVLGASNLTFAEATWTQTLPDWIGSHVHMFGYYGGSSAAIVPDNVRTGVTRACFYDPDINPTYQDLAVHYSTSVLPARPRRPRDKAKVEAGVRFAQTYILGRLRRQTFFSLAEANVAVNDALERLNAHIMRRLGVSRQQLLESLERPALDDLPDTDYEFAEWRLARVSLDYHVEVAGYFYSVPHALIREQVDIRATSRTVEVFHRGRRVAVHQRRYGGRRHGTDPAHMPSSHRRYAEWTPERFRRWGRSIGPNTEGLVLAILANRPHPEQGFRTCIGVLRLFRDLGPLHAEMVSARAIAIGALTYKGIAAVVAALRDRRPPAAESTAIDHPNLRGPGYFH